MNQRICATITPGHKIASGTAEDSPYPAGSISMQLPFFKAQGIDLSDYYLATLNLSIAPHKFKILVPKITVRNLHWAEGFPPEDFSFCHCEVEVNNTSYKGLIYYPHPETKIGHFHDASLIEVITTYIPNIHDGDEITLKYNPSEIGIS